MIAAYSSQAIMRCDTRQAAVESPSDKKKPSGKTSRQSIDACKSIRDIYKKTPAPIPGAGVLPL